jgi:hypothetical protein
VTQATTDLPFSLEERQLMAAAVADCGRLSISVRAISHGRAVCSKELRFFDLSDPSCALRFIDAVRSLEKRLLLRQAGGRDNYELTNFGWQVSRTLTCLPEVH